MFTKKNLSDGKTEQKLLNFFFEKNKSLNFENDLIDLKYQIVESQMDQSVIDGMINQL